MVRGLLRQLSDERGSADVSDDSSQVVITGAGLVTPLGLSREQTWRAVLDMRCGMGPMPAMESRLPPGADGGQAPDLPGTSFSHLPRETGYLRYALLQALVDAGIESKLPCSNDRCGIILGTTLHGMRRAGELLRSGDYRCLAGFPAAAVLEGAARGLRLNGCALTTCSACSSSLGAIALGLTLLRSGQLDVVVAGGYDTISEYVYAGFNSLRLVAAGPLRPFARARQGMKLAEGYGIVVLERLGDARRRGANLLATILGFGESADAHHLTQPHPAGQGAARAIREALDDAGLEAAAIDLIAAHATGTPDNDAGEFAALSAVFGRELPRIPVVAFKSHFGHTLGGAGAVELILSAMALRDQVVPACVNVGRDDIEFPGLNLATGGPTAARIRATLNTSLGFGGANTCMILGNAFSSPFPPGEGRGEGKAESPLSPPSPPPSPGGRGGKARPPAQGDVFITGMGVVFPGIVGNDAFVRRLQRPARLEADTGNVAEADIAELLSARRVRRMSDYVKVSLAAAALCIRDAGIEDMGFMESCAAILGTAHGSSNYSECYYRQIVSEGISAANPMLFAEGVPNAGAAHLSLMLNLKGPCQTIIGSRTAGLDALRLAAARIAGGRWTRAIVGAAEEFSPVVNEAYRAAGVYGPGGFVAGAGAVVLLLENRESMQSRRCRPRARVIAADGATATSQPFPRPARRILRTLGQTGLLITCANGTWIDRLVTAGLSRKSGCESFSPYGYIAECFSAMPLAGIAAVLLTRETPRFAALAADYAGAVSGVSIERGDL
jgi:3-oxoacyl-[acyl-carrier-protein] synthase II